MRLNPPAAGSYNDSQLGRMRTGSNSQYNHHQLDTIRQLPLEPMEYCRRWVSQQPGRNYRKVCINALAEVTGVSPQTIKDWGTNFHRRPKYITRLLRQADLINQFKRLVLGGMITLPPDFPYE